MLTKLRTNSYLGRNRRRDGAALLTALGVLGIVYLLGAAYVTYMSIETEDVQLTTRELVVRATAERGVMAALSEVGESLEAGETPTDSTYQDWPVFNIGADSKTPELQANMRAQVNVAVTDENAKINLNSAPVRLLESVLATDAATARNIRQALPRPGEAPTPDERWLVHQDELLTRGLVEPAQYTEMPLDAITVFPIPGTAPGAERLNVNTAGPHALAAAVDIDMEAARNLAEQQPFESMDAFVAAVGKDPAGFAVSLPGADAAAQTTVLSLNSRCYRLRSTAVLEKQSGPNGWRALGEMTLEAVAVFDDQGRAKILSWREVGLEESDGLVQESGDAAQAAAAEEAPTEESES